MSTLAVHDTSDALRPLSVTLSALAPLQGLANPLIVGNRSGWIPAAELVSGDRLPDLLDAATRRWGSAPHASATLAWKSYTYWSAMPAVLSWAVARRVPHVDADNVLVELHDGSPLLKIGLRTPAMTVLPDDPLATAGTPGISVAADEHHLLKTLRVSLLDRHLDPLAERIRATVKVGRRTLDGSIASAIAYGVIRAQHLLPGRAEGNVDLLLDALGLHDLVDLVPGEDGLPGVQRKTCCLAFTLPEPKICTGCCLRSC